MQYNIIYFEIQRWIMSEITKEKILDYHKEGKIEIDLNEYKQYLRYIVC